MPTDVFQGIIHPFPSITVDYFVSPRQRTGAFFLSHCHTDHIKGVDSDEFKQLLRERPAVKIYCTLVTANLLLKRSKNLAHLQRHFFHVTEGEWLTILLGDSSSLNVRTIPANHCLGSVMFLFEDSVSSALYTGDFRYNDNTHKEEMKAHLDSSSKIPRAINYLYLDTTFYTPKEPLFHNFPSRKDSEVAVVKLVKGWRTDNPTGQVHIDVTVGWENIFVAVAEHFECDVVMTDDHYEEYSDIKSVIFYLVKESQSKVSHWLHVNKTNKHCTLCQGDKVMKIRPSVQWIKHNQRRSDTDIVYNKTGDEWYVTHSMHSSYNEINQFISLVGAEKVYPIAVPHGMKEDEMRAELRKCWITASPKTLQIEAKTVISSTLQPRVPNPASDGDASIISTESEDIPIGEHPTPVITQDKPFESPIAVSPPALLELASSLEGLDVSPIKRVKRCTKKRANRQIFNIDNSSDEEAEEKRQEKKKRRQIQIDMIDSTENDAASVIDAAGKPEPTDAFFLGSSHDVESFDSRFEDMIYADILKAERFSKIFVATPTSSLEVSSKSEVFDRHIVDESKDGLVAENMDLLYDPDDMFNLEVTKTPEPIAYKLHSNHNINDDWMFSSPPPGKSTELLSWLSSPDNGTNVANMSNQGEDRQKCMKEVYTMFNDSDS